ncbi:hypothetical protein Q8F55_001729 [Vanrija albida]|uniref:Uncharacterized protein n=1 Tax=Vanrija albida TaxID=181172 RepID=A0ABR3Q815_9TREE
MPPSSSPPLPAQLLTDIPAFTTLAPPLLLDPRDAADWAQAHATRWTQADFDLVRFLWLCFGDVGLVEWFGPAWNPAAPRALAGLVRFHGPKFTSTPRTPAALAALLDAADPRLSAELYAGLLANPLFAAYALPLGARAPLDPWVGALFDQLGFVPQRLSALLALFDADGGRGKEAEVDDGPFTYRLDVVRRVVL